MLTLDIGSGGGVYAWKPRADVCVTIDRPKSKGREEVVVCDAHYLPFRDAQFDLAYLYNILEHVTSPVRVFLEAKRIAKVLRIRQDGVFNLGNYATPEHLWFQLPNLKFLKYPRTRLGIAFSKGLRLFLLQCRPKLNEYKLGLVNPILLRFMPPHQQYEVTVTS